MNLITIYNYADNKYEILLREWLHFAIQQNINIKIYTNTETVIPEFAKSYAVKKPSIKIKGTPKAKHNIGFKLFNLCNEHEPFIYVDVDAIIIKGNLLDMAASVANRAYTAINHEQIKGITTQYPPFLNSGVQIVWDTTFLSFSSIYKMMNKKSDIPGTDQKLLWQYFQSINYDYTSNIIGSEWNSCAKYAVHLNPPFGDVISSITQKNINILHYWYDSKPWKINCPIYEYFST